MTNLQLFHALCDVNDRLQSIAHALQEAASPQHSPLEVLVQRLDALIDATLRLDSATTPPSPCPHGAQDPEAVVNGQEDTL